MIDPIEKRLLEAARLASEDAYCKYSKFPVGAAIETVGGRQFVGCNVENASYGLTVCAERVAMFCAVAAGELELKKDSREYQRKFIRALAVTCPKGSEGDPNSLMPCGACRQVMAEFLTDDAVIFVDGIGSFSLKELLPHPFVLRESDEMSKGSHSRRPRLIANAKTSHKHVSP